VPVAEAVLPEAVAEGPVEPAVAVGTLDPVAPPAPGTPVAAAVPDPVPDWTVAVPPPVPVPVWPTAEPVAAVAEVAVEPAATAAASAPGCPFELGSSSLVTGAPAAGADAVPGDAAVAPPAAGDAFEAATVIADDVEGGDDTATLPESDPAWLS
jgi:hypothetical protein